MVRAATCAATATTPRDRRIDVRDVLELIERRKARVSDHPFYQWLRSEDVAWGDRFVFAPVFVNFIMGFRDMNRWFMRYPEPRSRLERAINVHTREDETHSRLFLEDWRKLGLDQRLGWSAGDLIAWYFAAPATELFRDFGMQILEMCVQEQDPLVRFSFMEAIESCGHVFFGVTAPVAVACTRHTGLEYRYFGPYHLARETGHLLAGEHLFTDQPLTEAQRQRAFQRVNRIFDMFLEENDRLLAYAQSFLSQPPPRPALLVEASSAPLRASSSSVPQHSIEAEDTVHPDQLPLVRRLRERKDAALRHPFFVWMESGAGTPAAKLRALVPHWVPDIMGYRDLTAYAIAYRQAVTPSERAINRWVRHLASHHRLFVHDWSALDMDRELGFSASDTLEYYCLSEETELQRRSSSEFIKLAFAHPEPVLRYWLMEALQASGESFFLHTSRLARAVEAETGCRLDYLADRHDLAHPLLEADPEAERVRFKTSPLAPAERDIALHMIDTVFDCLEAQFEQSFSLSSRALSQRGSSTALRNSRSLQPEVANR